MTKEQIGRCTYSEPSFRPKFLHQCGTAHDYEAKAIARQVINETLRLFPPVPLNIRRSLRPALLRTTSRHQDGTGTPLYMPGNTSIIINTVQMQRDPEIWGEDALDFKPERWQGKGGSEGFAAWNMGPRMVRADALATAP